MKNILSQDFSITSIFLEEGLGMAMLGVGVDPRLDEPLGGRTGGTESELLASP